MSNTSADATLSPAQAESIRDGGLHSFGTIHQFVMSLVKPLGDEQFFHGTCQGGNHVMWNIGHLAMAKASFLHMVGGTTSHWKEEWKPLFDMGSEPKPDPGAYPAPKEIVAAYEGVYNDFVAHFNALPGDKLAAEVGVEGFSDVAPHVAHIPGFATLHDSVHAGQITACRKAMGLERVMA